MVRQDIAYCDRCSRSLLAAWQGWPQQDPLPRLPKFESPRCESCGGVEALASGRIRWLNYHGPYNTGLPDYWLLAVDVGDVKWGHPYYAETPCPACGAALIVSEHPKGTLAVSLACHHCRAPQPRNIRHRDREP